METNPSATFTLSQVDNSSILVPSVRISVTMPDGAKAEAPLGLQPIVLGSSPECELIVSDPRVSRRHCELRLTPRGIILKDLGSKNGTIIDHVPVFEAMLTLGATATIGNSRFSATPAGAPSLVQLSSQGRFGEAVGESIAMRACFARLERVAATSETVLLLGESGTGKEVLARGIHAASPRADEPFVIFDCSAVAPNLLEAELFGYVRGAFTGAVTPRAGLLEEADGGTLFIDEIGEMPLDLQPKLLRALEVRQFRRLGSSEWRDFDARIIAATHRNLPARVADGSFREDLYYRLAVVEVHVPALRDRKEDIPLLVEHFLAGQPQGRRPAALPPHTMELLLAHSFPGNVRELRNTVTRLVLFPEMAQELLVDPSGGAKGPGAPGATGSKPAEQDDQLEALLKLPLHEMRELVVEQVERRYMAEKLRQHRGNISRIAEEIGASRQLVYRLIERYGLRGGGDEAQRDER